MLIGPSARALLSPSRPVVGTSRSRQASSSRTVCIDQIPFDRRRRWGGAGGSSGIARGPTGGRSGARAAVAPKGRASEIGRASCRERGWVWVGDGGVRRKDRLYVSGE